MHLSSFPTRKYWTAVILQGVPRGTKGVAFEDAPFATSPSGSETMPGIEQIISIHKKVGIFRFVQRHSSESHSSESSFACSGPVLLRIKTLAPLWAWRTLAWLAKLKLFSPYKIIPASMASA